MPMAAILLEGTRKKSSGGKSSFSAGNLKKHWDERHVVLRDDGKLSCGTKQDNLKN